MPINITVNVREFFCKIDMLVFNDGIKNKNSYFEK